ncbi:MAG TPA: alpha/beta fold hydrolase [Candidatus Acidoferrum sp.]
MTRCDCWRRGFLTTLELVTACAVILVASPVANSQAEHQIGEQEVAFRVGSVTLSGTLLRPTCVGSRPAIALLHGSGPGPRQQLRVFAERFARIGFAALIFDKRGSGTSGGSWTEESLDDLADDALAAVAFLKTQPCIDTHRVGVWGISQAGWVIPHAAARAPDAFAFAVIVTGGGVKPLETEEYDYAAALDQAGVTRDDHRTAFALVEKYFSYLRTGDDRSGMEHAIQEAREKSWFRAVDVSRVLPPESARSKWEWVATYDPTLDIQRMTMPVLVLIGGKDRPALSMKLNDEWRSNLTQSGNADSTVVEFLNADHGATMAGTHHTVYSGGPPTYVPGYLEMVDAWLKAHDTPVAAHGVRKSRVERSPHCDDFPVGE